MHRPKAREEAELDGAPAFDELFINN